LLSADRGVLENGFGAGFSFIQYYNQYVGTELSATWYDNHAVIHSFAASLILRYPLSGLCLAPYAIAGVGYHVNSVEQSTQHIGGGIDYRMSDCTGLFVEGRFVAADESEDYTEVRAGIRRGL